MSLYNKYRPKTFDDFIGKEQKRVAKLLKEMTTEGEIPSVVMFYGDHGAGKTSMARVLALAINCNSEEEKPCLKCNNCKTILENPENLITIINASDITGVDSIREVINSIKSPCLFSAHKVFIFDEMHNLSRQAQDCLLTITEFPPENTLIVFCTTEVNKVRPTLRSRCLEGGFNFTVPSRQEILSKMNEIYEKETGNRLPRGINFPHFSSVRHAISLLETFLFTGVWSDTSKEENASEAPWKLFSRKLVSTTKDLGFTKKEIASFLADFRKDPITTRNAITEYLHSVLINVYKGYSKLDISFIVNLIKIITRHDSKSMPALLSVDVVEMIKERYKYVTNKDSYSRIRNT